MAAQTYVNYSMQEKNRFELEQAVEVFVEVVETLQFHGFPEKGMQDAGKMARILTYPCSGGERQKNYCPGVWEILRMPDFADYILNRKTSHGKIGTINKFEGDL